jgi:hypothetical protein
MTPRRPALGLLLLMAAPRAAVASPYCAGCMEPAAALPYSTLVFTGEVESFDDADWSYQVSVERVLLGEPDQRQLKLTPNPMDSCHPRSLEPGSRWLILSKDRGYLPACSTAMLPLDAAVAQEELGSLEPLLAQHQRWTQAGAGELEQIFAAAEADTRAALEARIAKRRDPEAAAFWLQRLASAPSSLDPVMAPLGLSRAASDDTLTTLAASLGRDSGRDEIVLAALTHRCPPAAAQPLAAAYQDPSLPADTQRLLLALFEHQGLVLPEAPSIP